MTTFDIKWGSHIPILATAAAISEGPILELGMGHYSTHLLHQLCGVTNRRLVSVDTKPEWFKTFEHYIRYWHELYLLDENNWDSFKQLEEQFWGVALVDHSPGIRRVKEIERLADNADYIIVHDTEEAGFHYEPVLQTFRYRYDYINIYPWTTIVSNFNDLSVFST